MNLLGKRILLGISGGIAAYKCPDLVRLFKKAGADIQVVMTDSAAQFVAPMALEAVSAHPALTNLFDRTAEMSMSHIQLAKWADLILVAPATANAIAKLTYGMADDLLSTLCLATTAPIIIAPAMNQQMYHAEVTQYNLSLLSSRGVKIVGPDSGEQACGDKGKGRMVEPEQLVEYVSSYFAIPQLMSGISVTITAGPTIEELDPVRYLSNYSSGKMGFAIAEAAAELGADVTLISGPVHLDTPQNVTRVNIKSANEMFEASLEHAETSAIFIACAAVADYRPVDIASQKIKKKDSSNELIIRLVKNTDIIASIASMKKNRPFVVGFAAETENVEAYALKKLKEKKLDLICANDVSNKQIGFNSNQNQVTVYWKNGLTKLPLNDKKMVAKQLIQEILKHYEVSQHEK